MIWKTWREKPSYVKILFLELNRKHLYAVFKWGPQWLMKNINYEHGTLIIGIWMEELNFLLIWQCLLVASDELLIINYSSSPTQLSSINQHRDNHLKKKKHLGLEIKWKKKKNLDWSRTLIILLNKLKKQYGWSRKMIIWKKERNNICLIII